MKAHKFQDGGGKIVVNGKSRHPDSISIAMNASTAWRVITSLQAQLKDGEKILSFYGVGKLECDINEE